MQLEAGRRRVHSQSPTAQAWRRFRRHPLALAGLVLFGIVLLATLAAPLIARYDYAELNLPDKFQSPSLAHFLGTDRVGRDIWSRTLYGGRVSLAVGFAAASISTVIGVILGAVSGYYRGKTDQIIMRFTDVVMTFPRVVIILTAAIYLGQSIASVIFLIGIFSWPGITRLVRGQVLSLREQQFVLASRSLGSGNRRIIVSHVLPNVVAPLLASVTFDVNGAILLEAGLSFLGVGIPLPTPSWGNMLESARSLDVLQDGPWIWVPPAVMILLTVLSINFIGDGLRDAIDPRHQQG
ncbi:MAG: ABC transporter permease [Caldilineaceae bacterium SB0670_bin_27]|uniref:ABC transporter permease n=1 Tax=Caldilineaceae bacterium SB0664_bin_27 TaxID=2605260 RepID=A0A6B0YT28_9CHLR|nr:ABC transporter permease [Caldilineaceae bacterium SB0664_bin_27]MYJ76712.1 ABC transporter permease [Caldilineaceae bacterium SB0670_bin_27]